MSLENLISTERYEETFNNEHGDRSRANKNKSKKVTIDVDEMTSHGGFNRDFGASMESLDSLDTGQPSRTARDDVLESLGYKSNRIPKPSGANQAALNASRNLCHYCGRKVYPMEKIDIGKMYHKGCFKCHTCGLQLTLRTFCKVSSDRNEIFCKSHIPKLEASYDREAIEIQAAIKAQKKASEKVIKQFEPSPNKYDPDAIEFRHARSIKQGTKVSRRKSLKTIADYQKFGVFEAQEELERRHRQEEDKLYQEMTEERNNQIKNVENYLTMEKERTVKDLISWFENQGTSEEEKKSGLQKIEQYYKEQREHKIKELLDKMHFEEQEAVTRLTEKHAQEMLLLIEQRDDEVTEELGRHKPQYSKRSSYKEMQYQEANKELDGSEDELEDYDALENIDEEEHDDDGDDDGVDDDDKRKNADKITAQQIIPVKDLESYDDRELSPNKSTHKTGKESDNDDDDHKFEDKKYISHKDDSGASAIPDTEASTDRFENLTTKQKGRREVHRSEEKESRPYIKEGTKGMEEKSTRPYIIEVSEDTEEIHEKTPRDISKHARQLDLHYKEEKPNNESVSISKFSGIREESRKETKSKYKKPEVLKKQETKKMPVLANDDDDDDEQQTDDSDDDGDDNEDEETIEDRIKKVLKKNNVRVPYNKKDKETTNSPRERSDKNIWRSSNSGNLSLNKSSGEKSDRRTISKATENRSDKHDVRMLNSKERLNTSSETSRSDDDLGPRMSMPPNAEPPVCRKSKLYKDPEIFREFDENAFEEAKRDPTSFTDLVRRLSHKCKNDLQKVRAIFRWITAKDLNKMDFTKDLPSNTPMGLLRGIKSGTETYHNLFKRLCSYVGIHCKIINGFSKGVGYRPGSKFRDNKFRNQWTAVWIKDSWRFINCNWGARHVKQQGDLRLTYKIDEFYFLTDPEDHIQQHFPDERRWQLLRKPISIEEFVHLPVVKSPFFNSKLEFTSKTDAILKASHDGTVELCLRSPSLMSFAAKLQSKDRTFDDEQLSQQCLVRNFGDCTIFTVVLPQQGRYYWDIFVDKRWNSRSLDNACSFLIYCPQLPATNIAYFPQICFGRMPESETLNLKIDPEFDPFLKIKGEVQLDFDIKIKSNIKTTLSMIYVHRDDSKEVDCSQYVTILSRTKSNLSCFIRCPKKGRYIMNLLASDRSTPSNSVPIYKFFVDCRSPAEKTKFLAHTTSRFKDCRLVEPLDGELVVNSNVCFRVESGSAFEILVSVNETWFSLQKVDNLWQGIINTGPKVGKIVIFGRFREQDDKYIPFVEYYVKEPSMAEEVHALFKYMN